MAYRVAIGIASLHQRSLRDRPDIEPGAAGVTTEVEAIYDWYEYLRKMRAAVANYDAHLI
jgi:hypothetical protein